MTPAPARPKDDDALEDLPPLDADEPVADPDYTDMVDAGDDAGDPLDDATAEDDPQETLETGSEETGWLDDAEGTGDADEDDDEIVAFEGANEEGGDFDELGAGDEDYGLGAGEQQRHLDGGEEGPGEPDEELRDQDLPALDADDEGELDDAALVESTFAPPPEITIPRAARAWAPTGAPLDLGAVRAIAVAARGAIVAAAGLVRVDLEGACEPLAGPGERVDRLAAGFGLVAAVTGSGALALSRDDGVSFEIVRRGERHDAARDVAVTKDALWVLRRDGAIETSTHAAGVFTRVAGVARSIAIAAEPDGTLATLDERGVVARHVAAAEGGEGEPKGEGIAGATALAVAGGAALVAVNRDADDASWLVRVGAGGEMAIVAELGVPPGRRTLDEAGTNEGASEESDGAIVRAIAVDDAHGVVWVGGELGVLALEPAPE